MKVVLLITVTLALTLVHGDDPPCQRNPDNNAYKKFVYKHIVRDNFTRTSKTEWEKYLRNNELCDRLYRATQTFFEKSDKLLVRQTCDGKGKQLYNDRDLCVSNSNMVIHVVSVNQNCKVTKLFQTRKKVVVGCDKIGNACLPAHFERYTSDNPPPHANTCL